MQQAELHPAAQELAAQDPDVSVMEGLFHRYQQSRDGLTMAMAQVA